MIVRHFLTVALLVAAAASAAAQTLDTSRLARPEGSKVVYEGDATTILTVAVDVPTAARHILDRLARDGWQRYAPLNAQPVAEAGAETHTLKKGGQGLTLRVASAPGQGGATTVSYTANPLRHDLPFPADGRDIKFDPYRPQLEALTAAAFAEVHALYAAELGKLGWRRHVPPDGSAEIAGDGVTERAFFVRERDRPLLLFLRRVDGGQTLVKIEPVSPQLLPGTKKPEVAAPAPAPTPPPASPPTGGHPSGIDNLIDQALKQALEPPAKREPEPKAAQTALTAKPDSGLPIPLPQAAEGIDYDAADGTLDFQVGAPVTAVASFYRALMKSAGWTTAPSVIDGPTMTVLDFRRAGKSVTLTVMQMGPKTKVTARGSGLESVAPRATTASEPSSEPALEVTEIGGLPIPSPNTGSGRTKSLFLQEARATVKARVATVVAFYRAELTKRGWKETGTARVTDSAADLSFEAPDGPARLTLARKGNETLSTLFVRNKAGAEASGLLPKPGRARLLLGSMVDADSTVTVAGRAITVPAGVGQRAPDGPSLELTPGTHTVSIRVGKGPTQTETIKVGAGEIWGLLLGPGGALPLQAY